MNQTTPAHLQGPRLRASAPTNAAYHTLSVRRLTPILGAEIDGVDLSQPLSDEQFQEVGRALADHQVIFFRDQHPTPEQHLAFGQRFGHLHRHPAAPHAPGLPDLMIIQADEHSPRANGEVWHSDVSCDAEPPMGSILYIHTCPPEGGDTLFASMYAAYDALSERMKRYLNGLTAVHDGEHVYRGTYANLGVQDKPTYPRSVHPVVRTHPINGRKCLFVTEGHTSEIVGLDGAEGSELLEFLTEHVKQPQFQYRHHWKKGDLIVWDNCAVQHLAVFDYGQIPRRLHRAGISGPVPV
ncbi:MAG: hypothetical protein RLZZ395_2163 [Pseudomonadota bacterium]